VYATQGASDPAVGAAVIIEDSTGATYTAQTNEVGNFYVEANSWAPVYPAQVQVALGDQSQQMLTHIGRDGSCAGCHADPAGRTSPGRVYVAAAPVAGSGP
jgi:hypothetical protein